jgi:hypothetical protein
MSAIGTAYLDAAASAAELLRAPEVATAWDKPSALADFSVGGLAAHLAAQVLQPDTVLAAPVPDGGVLGLLDHYGSVAWLGTGLDGEKNVSIRRRGEAQAAAGPVALLDQVGTALGRLRAVLPGEVADRPVFLPWTGWSLSVDDFLTTRLLEIAVHSDDLAVSVGVPTPELPDAILLPVVDLLARLAVRRHGQTAVLRALGRAERAPASIAAI